MSEKIVQLNEAVIKSELKELVRGGHRRTGRRIDWSRSTVWREGAWPVEKRQPESGRERRTEDVDDLIFREEPASGSSQR